MTHLLITSAKPPDWHEDNIYLIDSSKYAEDLKSRWENIVVTEMTGIYCLGWRIPNPIDTGLKGQLDSDGGAITLSANPREEAIEFALWHRTIVPEAYPLFLFDEGLNVVVELKVTTTRQELRELLM